MLRRSRFTFTALGLALALGCTPPDFSLPTHPEPGAEASAGAPLARPLALPKDRIFPRVVEILMDMGYQVRSADADLGLVNLARTWYDETQAARPELSMEATLLFQPDGAGGTRVLFLPTGRWSVISVGGRHAASATVSGAQPSLEASSVQPFLDELTRRLLADAPASR